MCLCHSAGGQVILNPYLLASVGTEEAMVLVIRYPVIIAGYVNSAPLHTMQADENGSQVNIKHMNMIEQKTKHMI